MVVSAAENELLVDDKLVEGDVDESLVIMLEGHVVPSKWLWSCESRRVSHVCFQLCQI